VGGGLLAAPDYPEPVAPDAALSEELARTTGTFGTAGLVDDLRARPGSTAWTTDLGSVLTPGVGPGCSTWTAAALVGDDVVVSASSAVFGGTCTGTDGGGLARVDLGTGDVRWTLSGDQLGDASASWWTVSAAAPTGDGAAPLGLVSGSSAGGTDALTIVDLDTGEVVDGFAPTATDDDALASVQQLGGQLLLVTERPRSRYQEGGGWTATEGDTARYRLHRVADVLADRDLGAPVWEAELPDFGLVALLGDRLVTQQDDELVVVDVPADGAAVVRDRRPLDGSTLQSATTAGAATILSTVEADGGGAQLVALDADGAESWRRPLALDPGTGQAQAVPAASGCLQVVDGDDLVCLDVASGRAEWRTTVADGEQEARAARERRASSGTGTGSSTAGSGSGSGSAPTGPTRVEGLARTATSADAFVRLDPFASTEDGSPGDERSRTAAVGPDGAVRWRALLPADGAVVATSATTGYALSGWPWSGSTAVTAFDLADGRRLWQRDSEGSLQFWGPALVEVDARGVVRRLAPARVAR